MLRLPTEFYVYDFMWLASIKFDVEGAVTSRSIDIFLWSRHQVKYTFHVEQCGSLATKLVAMLNAFLFSSVMPNFSEFPTVPTNYLFRRCIHPIAFCSFSRGHDSLSVNHQACKILKWMIISCYLSLAKNVNGAKKLWSAMQISERIWRARFTPSLKSVPMKDLFC